MRSLVIGGLLASVMLVPAFAQANPPARNERPTASATTNEATQVGGMYGVRRSLKGSMFIMNKMRSLATSANCSLTSPVRSKAS